MLGAIKTTPTQRKSAFRFDNRYVRRDASYAMQQMSVKPHLTDGPLAKWGTAGTRQVTRWPSTPLVGEETESLYRAQIKLALALVDHVEHDVQREQQGVKQQLQSKLEQYSSARYYEDYANPIDVISAYDTRAGRDPGVVAYTGVHAPWDGRVSRPSSATSLRLSGSRPSSAALSGGLSRPSSAAWSGVSHNTLVSRAGSAKASNRSLGSPIMSQVEREVQATERAAQARAQRAKVEVEQWKVARAEDMARYQASKAAAAAKLAGKDAHSPKRGPVRDEAADREAWVLSRSLSMKSMRKTIRIGVTPLPSNRSKGPPSLRSSKSESIIDNFRQRLDEVTWLRAHAPIDPEATFPYDPVPPDIEASLRAGHVLDDEALEMLRHESARRLTRTHVPKELAEELKEGHCLMTPDLEALRGVVNAAKPPPVRSPYDPARSPLKSCLVKRGEEIE